MRHLTALIIKYAMTAVVAQIVLGLYSDLKIVQILLVAVAITAITYLIGDLLILSVFNNTVAAVADVGMCWLIIYLSGYVWPDRTVPLLSALSAAVIIGVGEILLHLYIGRKAIVMTGRMQ